MTPYKGAADSMPASRQLLRLYQTPKSSSKFESTFERFYTSDKYEEITDGLHGPELERFVDFLDELLKDKSRSADFFQKVWHALWSICGKRGVLPKSHIISEGVSRKGGKASASGGFAVVWKGELMDKNRNRRNVALKTIKITIKDGEEGRKKSEKAFAEEVSLWLQLKHPNIVRCFGATADPHQIVIDWMENGEIMKYIRSNPGASRTHLVLCVAKGLDYLHSRGVVHADLKPQNILVNAKGDACIADFGLSIIVRNDLSGGKDREARGHSSMWVAPETLIEGRISKEADVFCYGLVALEIFNGACPWGQATAPGIMTNITLGRRPVRPEGAEPFGLTMDVWGCLTKCWHQNPDERITISDVLSLLNSGTRAEGVTLCAPDPPRGDTTEPAPVMTLGPTGAPRRTSGSESSYHQRPDLYIPSRPGLTGLHTSPSHRHHPTTRSHAQAEVEASPLTKEETPPSHSNAGPVNEEPCPRRLKRFLRRCSNMFKFKIPQFPGLCFSSMSHNDMLA